LKHYKVIYIENIGPILKISRRVSGVGLMMAKSITDDDIAIAEISRQTGLKHGAWV